MVIGPLASIMGVGIGVPVLTSFMEGGLLDWLSGKASTEQKINLTRNITIGAVAGICVATIGYLLTTSPPIGSGQGLARRREYVGEMGYCNPSAMSVLPEHRKVAIY